MAIHRRAEELVSPRGMRASGSAGFWQSTVASAGGAASMGTGGRSRMVGRCRPCA